MSPSCLPVNQISAFVRFWKVVSLTRGLESNKRYLYVPKSTLSIKAEHDDYFASRTYTPQKDHPVWIALFFFRPSNRERERGSAPTRRANSRELIFGLSHGIHAISCDTDQSQVRISTRSPSLRFPSGLTRSSL